MKRSLHFYRPFLMWMTGILLSSFSLQAQTFSVITQKSHPYFGCLQLKNLPSDHPIKEDLQVFLYPQDSDNLTIPIIGQQIIEVDKIYFRPLIPFNRNLTYQARYRQLPPFTFQPEQEKDYVSTVLTDIYPSINELPENILKMYLHFSAPMSDGDAYQYIQMLGENGETIVSPFLELKPLLWNEDRTRLTLWFDPGRVKRDLLRHQKLGVVLEEGNTYTLSISKNWKDANGYTLANDFIKKIKVIEADRIAPNSKKWEVIIPKTGTKKPLIIRFNENMDRALATNSLSVQTQRGETIKGEIVLQKEDTEWQFLPFEHWEANTYQIQIKATLEDLAGNNLNRLFDRNIEKEKTREEELSYYYLDFLIE